MTNNICASRIIRVCFDDFEDLSKRLVLLPRIEDEGVGAVVASYSPSITTTAHSTNVNNQDDGGAVVKVHDCHKSKAAATSSSTSSTHCPAQEDDNNNNGNHQKQGFISTVSSDSTECRDEREDVLKTTATPTSSSAINLVGCVLVKTAASKELKNLDFATILAAIRGQKGPIVLELESTATNTTTTLTEEEQDDNNLRLEKSSSEGSHSTESDSDSSHEEEGEAQETNPTVNTTKTENQGVPSAITSTAASADSATGTTTTNNNNNNNIASTLLSGRLSAWGSRMRASAQLAAETASTVAVQSLQAAAASRAAAAKLSQESSASSSNKQPPCCGLHVQTSLGAFLPLVPHNQSSSSSTNSSPRSSSSELSVTISSVLYIRKSAVEACPPRGYTFQWYKGLPILEEDASLETDWILLPGATSAAFQPSTTEVGYRLLCVVTIDPKAAAAAASSSIMNSYDDDSDSDSSSDSDDENDDDVSDADNSRQGKKRRPTVVRCMTPHVVAADLSLFNGARQALVRGAHFGGLQGRGKATGRTFRVQVEIGNQHYPKKTSTSNNKKSKKKVASAVKIDQVSAATAEPLHVDPFYRVTARSCYTNSKDLDLKFRMSDLANNDNGVSLMSALVSDEEGLLELVAPNRFARESLLLALGIAKFKGKPADLDATTILYAPESDVENAEDNDGSEDWSSEDGSASVTSSVKSPEQLSRSGPEIVETLALSPGGSSRKRADDCSVASLSSAGDLSTIESTSFSPAMPTSVQSAPHEEHNQILSSEEGTQASVERQTELEQEIAFLRGKLAKKDKVVSELQRHVARSDAEVQQANQRVSQIEKKVAALEVEAQSSQKAQNATEQIADQHVATIKKLKENHSAQVSKLNQQLENQANTIADLEKTVKSHQNEKAVLSAAVEARESKLSKMAELQESFVALSSKVSQQDQWRKELDEITQRYQELKGDLQKVTQLEKDCRQELESTKETLQAMQEELQTSKVTAESCRKELKVIQTKNQKLKSERNSYKQKADSLAKEISRICRNRLTLADVERILANDEARQEEVQLLRKQKRKALEECHSYRKSYEQSRAAQQLMVHANAASPNKNSKVDPNNNSALLLERNVELERLVTDLTEYVNAKEMQLETLKQVNTALQEEIHGLAKANMHQNEI